MLDAGTRSQLMLGCTYEFSTSAVPLRRRPTSRHSSTHLVSQVQGIARAFATQAHKPNFTGRNLSAVSACRIHKVPSSGEHILQKLRCHIGLEPAVSFGTPQLYTVERQRLKGVRLEIPGLVALIGLKGACSLPSRTPCTTPHISCRQSS